MIHSINNTFDAASAFNVIAQGGIDAEYTSEYSSITSTLAWAKGFDEQKVSPYDPKAKIVYYNYGSCTDCPRGQDRNTWTRNQMNALERVYLVSASLDSARALPQIYKAPFALEGYNAALWSQLTHYKYMKIPGVVTSCHTTACNLNDTSAWRPYLEGSKADTFLSPYQGWSALYDTTRSSTAPDGSTNVLVLLIFPG